MLRFKQYRLPVTKEVLESTPPVEFIGILHALNDTREFIHHALESGHKSDLLFAKPYSKDLNAINDIQNLGLSIVQEPYSIIEGIGYLDDIISTYNRKLSKFILVDVGGYFAAPLSRLQEISPEWLPNGVVEVTTFGHNRYNEIISDLKVPVVSIARSPLKDVEAHFVGESSWLAIDSILRNVGLSPFGKKVGIVGYGMIGRRVASVAKANGAHTSVFDKDSLKLLDARSYKHKVDLELTNTLSESDIVVCATGGQCISYEDMLEAKDGIIFASAGSKIQEIDVVGLRINSIQENIINEFITEYILENGKSVYILRGGAAVNFILGSCPDHTMDLVFAEIAASMRRIILDDLALGVINEVEDEDRRYIARKWLKIQNQ